MDDMLDRTRSLDGTRCACEIFDWLWEIFGVRTVNRCPGSDEYFDRENFERGLLF